MFSNTQMKQALMRIAVVKAATHTVPRPLLELCSMMLPMAVMLNCSPMGMPLPSSVSICRTLVLQAITP